MSVHDSFTVLSFTLVATSPVGAPSAKPTSGIVKGKITDMPFSMVAPLNFQAAKRNSTTVFGGRPMSGESRTSCAFAAGRAIVSKGELDPTRTSN